MERSEPKTDALAPDIKGWKGYFPNPLKVLDRKQIGYTAAASTVSSATFVFSPVAMTVLMGELVGARIRERLSPTDHNGLGEERLRRNPPTSRKPSSHSSLSALPLSPLAAGPAAPLFNAPPVFETNQETGVINNLSTYLTQWEFLLYGLLAVVSGDGHRIPVCHELRVPRCVSGGQAHQSRSCDRGVHGTGRGHQHLGGRILGLLITVTVGLVGGLLGRLFKIHGGVLFMGYYVALFSVPALINLF